MTLVGDLVRLRDRFLLFVVSLFVLNGCGSSPTEFVSEGETGTSALRLLSAGSGPVVGQSQANAVVVGQFLGLNTAGLLLQSSLPLKGTDGQPFLELFAVPGGELAAGTRIGRPNPSGPPTPIFVLDESYFLFLVDPLPLELKAHTYQVLYVRSRDGALLSQDTDWDPYINDEEPLESLEQRQAVQIYGHEFFDRIRGASIAPRAKHEILARSDTPSGGPLQSIDPSVAGVFLAGSGDARGGEADIARGLAVLDSFSHTISQSLIDRRSENPLLENRLTRDDVEQSIMEVSQGLKAEDGFIFQWYAHGDIAGDWGRAGRDMLRYAKLCEWINEHVPCCNIFIVLENCYAGRAQAAFRDWPLHPGQRVTIITAVGESTNIDPNTGEMGIMSECMWNRIDEQIAIAEADGILTLNELHQAILAANPTVAELEDKLCEFLDQTAPPNLTERQMAEDAAWKRLKVQSYTGTTRQSLGPNDPTPEPPEPPETNTVDSIDLPEEPKRELDTYLARLESGDRNLLAASYINSYDYAGQDLTALLQDVGLFNPVYITNLLVSLQAGDGVFETVWGLHTQTDVPGSPGLEVSEVFYLGQRWQADSDGTLLINREAKIRWNQTVKTKDSALVLPDFPTLTSLQVLTVPVAGLRVFDGTQFVAGFDSGLYRVQAGQPIPISLQVEGLVNGGQAQAFINGQLTALNNQGGGLFTAQVNAPINPGLYQLQIFAFNNRTNGIASGMPGHEFAQTVRGRSVEVEVTAP